MLGWGTFAGGIGKIIEKISTYIPGKIEGIKNEIERLEKEKAELKRKGINDEKKSARYEWIVNRLDTLNKQLRSKAQD